MKDFLILVAEAVKAGREVRGVAYVESGDKIENLLRRVEALGAALGTSEGVR